MDTKYKFSQICLFCMPLFSFFDSVMEEMLCIFKKSLHLLQSLSVLFVVVLEMPYNLCNTAKALQRNLSKPPEHECKF